MIFSFTPTRPGSKHFEHYEVCGVLASALVLEMVAKWAPKLDPTQSCTIPGSVWTEADAEVPYQVAPYVAWAEANVPSEFRQKEHLPDPSDELYENAFHTARRFVALFRRAGIDCIDQIAYERGVEAQAA